MSAQGGASRLLVLLTTAICLLSAATAAQESSDTRQIQAYIHAVTRPRGPQRNAALEQFAAAAPRSSLRLDALELLTWENRGRDNAAAMRFARELLASDAGNPLALAVVTENAISTTEAGSQVSRALSQIVSMRVPEGMTAAEFAAMQQQVIGILCGAVGTVALEHNNYESARQYLKRAAEASPNDARYAYQLGLADLQGKNPDEAEGYWYLARAANLARGTPAGEQIAQYARQKYQEDGGRATDWDGYMAAAVTPNAPPIVVARTAPPAAKATTATVAKIPRAADIPRPEAKPGDEDGALAEAGLPAPDAAHLAAFRVGAPLSLGILVEASLAESGNRKAIVNAVSDMVRHLSANQQSEAFLLSFGKDIVFDQDLTGNYREVETALEKLHSDSGTALTDAVTFAAFHLNRVAQPGNNRVLFVISDGQDTDSKMSALETSGQLSTGVRVFCIGMGALSSEGVRRLQALAARTGGQAAFVTTPAEFRGAAVQMAQKFGVEFPY